MFRSESPYTLTSVSSDAANEEELSQSMNGKIWLKKTYLRVFPNYEIELERAIGDSKTVLDVGCGHPSPIRKFSRKFYSVGVDAFEPSIEKSRAEGIHNDYLKAEVLEIGARLSDESFDCVLASDLIEHLEKEDGLKLLQMMEKIAKKRVIVFTPNGFTPQGFDGRNPWQIPGNQWQIHRSGWTPEEMRAMGYKVIGINGLKSLRGEFGFLKHKPSILWQPVSDLTQIVLKRFPSRTFQILCVKEL
jgi:SAM-dependent methyltransferase